MNVLDRIVVRIDDDPDYPGVAFDVAPDEIGLYVHRVRCRGERIDFSVERGGIPAVRVAGDVMSSRHVADGWAPGCRYELRVRLVDPPSEWSDVIEATDGALDRRDDNRYAVALPVEFVEPPGSGTAMTRNIAEGGAFVTGTELALGDVCVVRVALPAVPERLWAVGKVVRVGDDGVGLRFLEMHSETRLDEALAAYRSPARIAIPRTAI